MFNSTKISDSLLDVIKKSGILDSKNEKIIFSVVTGISVGLVAGAMILSQLNEGDGETEKEKNAKGKEEGTTDEKPSVFDLDKEEVDDIIGRAEHALKYLNSIERRIATLVSKCHKLNTQSAKFTNTVKLDAKTIRNYAKTTKSGGVFASTKCLVVNSIPYGNGVRNAWEKLLWMDDLVNNRIKRVIIDGSNLSYTSSGTDGKMPKFIGISPTVEVVRLLKEKYAIDNVVVVLDANYTKKMKKNGFNEHTRQKIKDLIKEAGGEVIFASSRNEADKNILMFAMEDLFAGSMPRIISNDRMIDHVHAHDYKKDISQVIQWHVKHDGEDSSTVNAQSVGNRVSTVIDALLSYKNSLRIKDLINILDNVESLIKLTKDERVPIEYQEALREDMITLISAYVNNDSDAVENAKDMLYGPAVRALNRLPAPVKRHIVYDSNCHDPDKSESDIHRYLLSKPPCTTMNFITDFLRIGFESTETGILIPTLDEQLYF